MRLGLTLPFGDVPLPEHRPLLRELVAAGYRDIATGESNGNDAHLPLALFAGWEPGITLNPFVASAFTRGPGIMAMTAATLAEIAPGRVRFGIGAGSDVIVTGWNGVPFDRPYRKVADTLRFLREVLAGGRATDRETVHAEGFVLTRPPATPPALVVAALGPRMQRLAAAEADGVILNFLGAGDIAQVREHADLPRLVEGPFEVGCRIFVMPGEGPAAELAARRLLAGYLTVPVYARFQEWLGRGAALAPMQRAWADGDRRGAVRAIPDDVLREIVLFGTAQECAKQVREYAAAGVDAATLSVLPSAEPGSPAERVRFLIELAAAVAA
ncbi:LLM class F420-dependent oxidoreductase [Pseudonocardia sp. GCM10023141]|uniref:LLM class F420-dependent oxidoreductase n=1 Tax=Pseudonocardia sp. GCM10023141 TaxID=3252653 RepID=UPI0036153B65